MSPIRQSVYVSVAHRYWNDQWSREKNHEIYGDDASVDGLGSNLRLEVAFSPASSPSLPARALAHLKSLVDHECLFTAIPQFVSRPSTLESITDYLSQQVFTAEFREGDAECLAVSVWESETLGCTRVRAAGDLELHLKCLNLTLNLRGPADPQSGLVYDRREVRQVVRQVFFEFGRKAMVDRDAWGLELYAVIKQSLPQLHTIAIDLGRQEYLLIPEPV